MTPNEIFFGFITAAIIALVIVLIWLVRRIVEAIGAVKEFLVTAERSMQESLGEVNLNLKSMRTITDNISTVTGDITAFSGSVRDVGDRVKQVTEDVSDGVRQLTDSVKQIGDVVQSLGTETAASVCGLRAGLRTGIEVFLKNLFQQGAAR
jgi:uncharacterized protein YoxC